MKALLASIYKHHLLLSICMAASLMLLLMLTPVSASASTKHQTVVHRGTIHRTIHQTILRKSIYLRFPIGVYGLPLPILGPLPVFGPYPYYPPYPYSYPDPDAYPYFPYAAQN